MKRTYFLFNPENDLALANGSPYFCAPNSAKMMSADLSLLPLWFATEAGTVLAENLPVDTDWLEMISKLELKADWIKKEDFLSDQQTDSDLLFSPWGWSPACVGILQKKWNSRKSSSKQRTN